MEAAKKGTLSLQFTFIHNPFSRKFIGLSGVWTWTNLAIKIRVTVSGRVEYSEIVLFWEGFLIIIIF